MGQIGFTVVAVKVRYSAPDLERAGPGFEERIGATLEAAGLGHFDSMEQGDPFNLFFYLATPSLQAGLDTIKRELEELGILALCKIAIGCPAEHFWRVCYPYPEGLAGGLS